MGILYIVSTPIGNLEDITIRAIKTLFCAEMILCEDTRRTGLLLNELDRRYPLLIREVAAPNKQSGVKLIPFHQHNERRETAKILRRLENEATVVLVSDAGTPLLSDPGFPLVAECIKKNIKIVPVPGASSILTALAASGMPPYPFLFLGFPPEKSGKRRTFFTRVASYIHPRGEYVLAPTVIFFAATHKIVSVLEDVLDTFGDVQIVIARELTKVHEEFIRGTAREIIERFNNQSPKGELTVLFQLKERK